MQIKNLLLKVSRQFGRLQRRSDAFWQRVDNSYFASPAVYAAREEALREALVRVGPVQSAIDVGCGDGRFTLVLREAAARVDGYDISVPMIEQARQRAVAGVVFHLCDLEQFPTSPPHPLVACLGVTSCLVDDWKFSATLDRLAQTTAPGGHLVMVDTLSEGKDETRAYRSGYIATYRNRTDYEARIERRGFDLVERRYLADSSGHKNYLFVFKRR